MSEEENKAKNIIQSSRVRPQRRLVVLSTVSFHVSTKRHQVVVLNHHHELDPLAAPCERSSCRTRLLRAVCSRHSAGGPVRSQAEDLAESDCRLPALCRRPEDLRFVSGSAEVEEWKVGGWSDPPSCCEVLYNRRTLFIFSLILFTYFIYLLYLFILFFLFNIPILEFLWLTPKL